MGTHLALKAFYYNVSHSFATKTAIKKENRILKIESDGRGALAPIMAKDSAKKQLELTSLNKRQKDAALLITTTTNRIVGIQGFAGTGKSHMLKAASIIDDT